MTLFIPSRRGFLTGLASVLAAPAVVRAASLMPVRALLPAGWHLGPVSAIPYLNVQPEWVWNPLAAPFTLDAYASVILRPMVDILSKNVAAQIMKGSNEHSLWDLSNAPS